MKGIDVSFDLVVLGEDLSLVATALAAARKGLRVLAVPANKVLPWLDEAWHPPYLDAIQPQTLLAELGLNPTDFKTLESVEPAWQLLTEDARIGLDPDDRYFAKALLREKLSHSEQEAEAVAADMKLSLHQCQDFFGETFRRRQVIFGNWFERRGLKRLELTKLARLPQEAFWLKFARALSLKTGMVVPSSSQSKTLKHRTMALMRYGSFNSRSLVPIFRRHLEKRGVEVLDQGELTSIEGKRKRLHSLNFENCRFKHVSFDRLAIAMDPLNLAPLFNESGLKSLQEWLIKPKRTLTRYVLPIKLLREGLPVGLRKRALYVNDFDKPLVGDNFLSLETDLQAQGEAVVWVSFLMPIESPVDDDTMSAITRRLSSIIPFFEENTLPPAATPKAVAKLFGPPKNEKLTGGGYPMRTPLKNVFQVGPCHLPALGVEGELLSALALSDLIAKEEKTASRYVVLESH